MEILRVNGPNKLTPARSIPAVLKLLRCLFGGFNILLWLGALASVLSYLIEYRETANETNKENLFLGLVLAIVVTITGFFAFYQEMSSSRIMESFAQMIPPRAKVIRDGCVKGMDSADVVIGDVVLLKGGDRIPADIRILTASGFKVMGRIAMLTSRVSPGKTPIAKEITHFIWIISVIAFIIGGVFFVVSLLLRYTFLEALVFLIGIIVANVPEGITATVTVCLTLTAVRMRKKNCLVKKLEGVETLGSTSIICSDKTGTLTQNRMTVTHLWVNGEVEAAMSQDRSCVLVDSGALANEKTFIGGKGSLLRCASLCSNADFMQASDRSTKASQREARGDASEVAILRYCETVCGDVRAYRQLYPKVCEIPFNSTNKYQVSIHKTPARRYLLVMKGAPEKILTCCSTVFINGAEIEINKNVKESFKQTYEFLGGLGERVLGFCDLELDQEKYGADYKFTSETPNFPLTGLRFLGLIAMIDPPRPAVPHAVRLCKSAGIKRLDKPTNKLMKCTQLKRVCKLAAVQAEKVVMVTGDHPITAQAIARQVHIIEQGCDVAMLVSETDKIPNFDGEKNGKTMRARGIVIHGERLRYLSEDQLDYITANVDQVVFARTSPAQKLQIVETFQRAGGVVAVTGDGVNDAPALRKADIGIAMGIAGTDVSKEAADMILLDDNFASIVTGVEEGRIIFDNLKKSIAYTLTSNIPGEWPAISIAYEEAESDIMKRPPRNSERDKLVNARLMNFSYLQIGVMQAASAFMTYFFIMGFHGFLPSHLIYLRKQWDNKNINDLEDSFGQQWTYQSRKELEHCCHGAFFYSIVVVQWADLIISKTRYNSLVTQGMSNMVLNEGLVFTTILASVLLFTPYVNEVFLLTPIRLEYALVSLPFAFLIFAYDEMRKFLCRKYPDGWMYHETFY
uniref:Sodium/potassium-transporting ATPase subunit alpha n=1 Tax=Ascaris lumbricoides TaxID=6252 RepID=A0A0M3HZJ6_ASCLU